MSVAAIGLHLRHSPATGRRGIERPSSSLLLDSGRDSPDASGIEISLTLTTHHHDASKKLLHRAVLQENGYDTRDLRSKRLVADRGYDADALRGDLRSAGTMPVIPGRRTRKHPVRHDAARYKDRWRIEAAFTASRTSAALPPATTSSPPTSPPPWRSPQSSHSGAD